jgi:hypothetical protein
VPAAEAALAARGADGGTGAGAAAGVEGPLSPAATQGIGRHGNATAKYKTRISFIDAASGRFDAAGARGVPTFGLAPTKNPHACC